MANEIVGEMDEPSIGSLISVLRDAECWLNGEENEGVLVDVQSQIYQWSDYLAKKFAETAYNISDFNAPGFNPFLVRYFVSLARDNGQVTDKYDKILNEED